MRGQPAGPVGADPGAGGRAQAALVERGRGRITLTAEGEEIARRASRILAEVDDLEDYARHGTRLLTGPLRLGVIPSIAPYLLPAALPRLQERYPALELRLRESQTAVIVDELQRGALDVLVLSLPLDDGRARDHASVRRPVRPGRAGLAPAACAARLPRSRLAALGRG